MRKLIAATLVAGALAAPSTVLAHGPDERKGSDPGRHVQKKVEMVFMGVVAADATADSVALRSVDGVNRNAARVLGANDEMTIKLSGTRLMGKVLTANGSIRMGRETFGQLKAGDRVFFVIRAPKRTTLGRLPAARWLKDFTYNAPVTPPPADPVTPPVDGGETPPSEFN